MSNWEYRTSDSFVEWFGVDPVCWVSFWRSVVSGLCWGSVFVGGSVKGELVVSWWGLSKAEPRPDAVAVRVKRIRSRLEAVSRKPETGPAV